MNSHPAEGARLILAREEQLDLAAVVAYEHHVKVNGGGYPSFEFPRRCHSASNLVHVCDVFDALRTDRPYRDAWTKDRAIGLIRENAGEEFDPDIVNAFLRMMSQWETRVAELREEDQALPLVTGGFQGASMGEAGATTEAVADAQNTERGPDAPPDPDDTQEV
jgi:putative two-component system response regulator